MLRAIKIRLYPNKTLKSSDRLKQEVKYAQIIDFRRISYTV